jgi:6-phosphogluconolactonase (cycloisomerase 2 family)
MRLRPTRGRSVGRQPSRRTVRVAFVPPRTGWVRRGAVTAGGVAVLLALSGPAASATPPPLGELTELGCIRENAGGGCSAGDGLADARGVAVSPDGKNVYVASGQGGGSSAGALAAFARDPNSGALTELNCVSAVAGDGCTVANELQDAWGVAVSPDGATIYATAHAQGTALNGGVAAFARDPVTGAIGAEINCVNETATATCAGGHGIEGAEGIAVSDTNIYVAASGANGRGGLSSFARAGGGIGAELNCFNGGGSDTCMNYSPAAYSAGVALSRDGHAVYGAGSSSSFAGTQYLFSFGLLQTGALSTPIGCVSSDPGTPAPCASASQSLAGAFDVAVSPGSDRSVYAAAAKGGNGANPGGVASAGVDANTDGITGLTNCYSQSGTTCPTAAGLLGATGVALSADGADVYVAAQSGGGGGAITVFPRDQATGSIGAEIQCIAAGVEAGCQPGNGLAVATFVAVSPDGRNVYVTSGTGGGDGGVAIFTREQAPTCTNTTAATTTGSTVAVSLTCADPNGDPVTRSIVAGPLNGTLGTVDDAAGTVAYTPNAGFTGNDTFTFEASDGRADSGVAQATIQVSPAAPAPPATGGPRSRIAHVKRRVRSRKLKRFSGTASAPARVARVQIALERLDNGARAARRRKPSCEVLASSGRLKRKAASKGRCKPRGWLKATGTTAWSFRLKRRLPKGRYVLYSRAVDAAGKTESTFSVAKGNEALFKVI